MHLPHVYATYVIAGCVNVEAVLQNALSWQQERCTDLCWLQDGINGCMIVVTLCCHVRRYRRVCHLLVQIALSWLRQGSLVLCLSAWYFCLLQPGIVNRIGVAASRLWLWVLSKFFSFLLKSASESFFCAFGAEIRFWSCNFCCHSRHSIWRFATQCLWITLCWLHQRVVNHIGLAASRLRCWVVSNFDSQKLAMCKSLLCVKASVGKKLLCVKAHCVKASVCRFLSV